MTSTKDLTLQSYNIINSTANSNVVLQGLSGLFGFPTTIIVDGVTIFTHYAPMLDKIRLLYHKEPLTKEVLAPLLKNITNELLFDLVFDKGAGQLPIAGIYFNAICAKALTWRLGILFAICSSLENDITDTETLSKTIALIRNVFPQKDIFKFTKPDFNAYKKIMSSIANDTEEAFTDKINEALKAFEI